MPGPLEPRHGMTTIRERSTVLLLSAYKYYQRPLDPDLLLACPTTLVDSHLHKDQDLETRLTGP